MATNGPNIISDSDNSSDATKRTAASTHSTDEERQEMRESKERLAYDFKEMLSSAEALLRSTAKYTGVEVEEARTRLQQQLDMARERSGDMAGSIKDAGQRFAAQTDECVHKHPWTCIGVAFVAGMVFAHCSRSRD